jgi:hypothetical protein
MKLTDGQFVPGEDWAQEFARRLYILAAAIREEIGVDEAKYKLNR